MRPDTQSRVVPYLNVAAPAAFVDAAPPAVAPANVGTGGYAVPSGRSTACMASSGTPASTEIREALTSTTRDSRAVLNTTSPKGVAPPVSDD